MRRTMPTAKTSNDPLSLALVGDLRSAMAARDDKAGFSFRLGA